MCCETKSGTYNSQCTSLDLLPFPVCGGFVAGAFSRKSRGTNSLLPATILGHGCNVSHSYGCVRDYW